MVYLVIYENILGIFAENLSKYAFGKVFQYLIRKTLYFIRDSFENSNENLSKYSIGKSSQYFIRKTLYFVRKPVENSAESSIENLLYRSLVC